VSPSSRIDLASGMVNSDRLLIELIQAPDSQPIVAISWPGATTIAMPANYPA
jgi:hypothetical protein